MNESELIDRYIDALNRDPNAAPPPGLDADTAAFVRALVQSEQRPAPGRTAQDRVWHRAMSLAENPPTPGDNRHPSSRGNHIEQRVTLLKSNEYVKMEDSDMNMDFSQSFESLIRVAPGTHPPRQRYFWQYTLTIAAALVMLALLGGILIEMVNHPNSGYPAAVALQTEAPTCETGLDYMAQGESSISAGDYAAALTAYNCAIEVDPANNAAYLLRGGLAGANGDYDQMGYDLYASSIYNPAAGATGLLDVPVANILPTLASAITARPDDAPLYVLRGLVLSQVALGGGEDFIRFRQLMPDNAVGYLFSWGPPASETDEHLLKAIELDSDSTLLLWTLWLNLNEENVAFIKPYFDRAIEANPAHPFAYKARGHMDVILGDTEAATSDFYQHIQNSQGEATELDGLTLGEAFVSEVAVGGVYRLPLTLQAGQKLNVVAVRSDGLSGLGPTVVVLNPVGEVMSAPYILGDNVAISPPIEGLEISESGVYTLLVKANSLNPMSITMSATE